MFGDIANSEGERLDYSFHEGSAGSRDVVVIGHGVTGNKDRPFVIALAEGLAAAGINALRFSFADNGDSGGRFVDATISKEVEDAKNTFKRYKWPTIDVTRKSVEETAASIIKIYEIFSNKKNG